MSIGYSTELRLCVEVESDIFPFNKGEEDYWTWRRVNKRKVRILGISGGRPREGRSSISEKDWCLEYFDGSPWSAIEDEESAYKPGRYVVVGKMWWSTDYWGEHDEGFDVDRVEPSRGGCERFWRRRAHARKARKS